MKPDGSPARTVKPVAGRSFFAECSVNVTWSPASVDVSDRSVGKPTGA